MSEQDAKNVEAARDMLETAFRYELVDEETDTARACWSWTKDDTLRFAVGRRNGSDCWVAFFNLPFTRQQPHIFTGSAGSDVFRLYHTSNGELTDPEDRLTDLPDISDLRALSDSSE